MNHNTGDSQLIDHISYCLKEAENIFSEKQIEEAVTAFCSNGIAKVGGRIHYDPAAQKFFRVIVDGNYYHGYDVDYMLMSKDEVISWHMQCLQRSLKVGTFDHYCRACREGKVPMLVILSRLSESEGPYSPPDNFGYGLYFV